MATDSTELTFVRCPSCRSLVPAVSTRCRMCGAGLDANASQEAADQDKKGGRVRQRTMSQPQSELNAAVGKLRAEEVEHETPAPSIQPKPTPAPEQATVPSPMAIVEAPDDQEASEELDPLSAYIEEVDDEAASAADAGEATPSVSNEAASSEHRNGSAAKAPEPVSSGIATAGVASIPAAHILVTKTAPVKTAPPAASAETVISTPAEEAPVAVKSEPVGQRVIIESGMRRPGKGGGLSFGAKKEATPVEAPAKPQPDRQEVSAPAKPVVATSNATPSPKPVQRSEPRTPPVQTRATQSREEAPVVENREREERSHNVSSRAQTAVKPSEGVKKAEGQTGRLFGWLVNYSNPDGDATELREGKFFVTASSLKSSDLILEDSSVSTPHALCVVSTDTGFQVQDLMSDRGVFVRRRGADSYQREYEIVSVEHGDWVRFGDVEFLVSLIAHVGER